MEYLELDIIWQDDYLVAVNKPPGLLVHRTSIAADAKRFALQFVRKQTGKKVFPIHRLDRKTSGILLFAFSREITRLMQQQFLDHSIDKRYLAITRGYFPESIKVDYPLTNDKQKLQEAITFFKNIKKTELDIPFGKHQTSRYSLIEARPKTGRMHQIRKHCNHLRHPIIGDRPHGCNKQNRLFKERWEMTTMLLHASDLRFIHPTAHKTIHLKAKPFKEFVRMQQELDLIEDQQDGYAGMTSLGSKH